MPKIGLVLSGGGYKALAQIGVLKVLDRYKIKVDAAAGCSMGSILGVFYAAGRTPDEIEDFVIKQSFRSFLDLSMSKLGIDKTKRLQRLIEDFARAKRFKDLKIPMYINATNISKQREAVFSKGELFQAIRASVAVPGIFAPVKIKNDYYVDGGVLNNIPFSILPKNINRYIIIDVIDYGRLSRSKKMSITNLMEKSIVLMMEQMTKLRLEEIDKKDYVIIKPVLDIRQIIPNEKKFRQIIREGERAALKKIPEIRRKFDV
ncbi:hypothetical protein AYK26_05900 [Euryarchaeota archaeon SM23-78]|nr:MAG: hypothetical protein AYK26_05900 [Euryarchaeota archaeon SM23-78]MBW3001344.1 patatin-like phospholipase family protein [Candidatus Woesearchaeota archaeon]